MVATYTVVFKIKKFHSPPEKCIFVFCKDLGTSSHYFLTQHSGAGFHCAVNILRWFSPLKSVPWVRQLVFGPLPRRPGFDAGQSILNVLWTECKWDRFFSEYFGFPLSISFQHCSILVFIYMFLLPERKTGEAWEPSKTQGCFGERRALNRKLLLPFFPSLRIEGADSSGRAV